MKTQNYKNHIRYYTPHHFVFYPVVAVLTGLCVYHASGENEQKALWLMLAAVLVIVCFLSLMLRQHYALINQNRIVRLELRLRYYVLTQKRFEEVEAKLSAGQVYALRFAPDEELPALVERSIRENLSSDEIKKSIKNWLPDEMRV